MQTRYLYELMPHLKNWLTREDIMMQRNVEFELGEAEKISRHSFKEFLLPVETIKGRLTDKYLYVKIKKHDDGSFSIQFYLRGCWS